MDKESLDKKKTNNNNKNNNNNNNNNRYREYMGAGRYGIFLRAFNSIAHEWDAELNSRKESSYLQATMYYFVYHIDTISLYWQEKSTLLTNENKGSTIPE
mgnify:CR=1 FL=1